LLAAFSRCYDLSTVSLRYFNIFGPRQDPKSPYAAAIAAFTDAFTAGRQPTVFGTGEQTRDFTYIDNVVHANLLAAASDHPLTGEVINIGTGRETSLLEVIDALANLYGMAAAPTFAEPRPGDVIHSVADITRARDLLGYEPLVDFNTGLARTIEAQNQTTAADTP
jgi:nucleoside-diphosphate-sugar epimerase